MIVKRNWVKRGRSCKYVYWSGLFLFGLLPLFVWQKTYDVP